MIRVMTYGTLNQPQEQSSQEYHRGTFIDTLCRQAIVSDYQGMKQQLERLSSIYPLDAKMTSIGESVGYGGPGNTLDIWSLQIPATVEPKQTAFFVSGHHYWEVSGPETVYEIAKRILESYSGGNPHVQKMRESTHCVFIPQINVDAYNVLSMALQIHPRDFRRQAYSRFLDPTLDPDALEFNRITIQECDINFYVFGNEEDSERSWLHKTEELLFAPYRSMQRTVGEIIRRYGRPFLAFDYHEHGEPDDFMVFSYGEQISPVDVYTEVEKTYPVLRGQKLRNTERKLLSEKEDDTTFSAYLAYLGAYSFLLESPEKGGGWDLCDRVEMNLISTDRILAKYFLDI